MAKKKTKAEKMIQTPMYITPAQKRALDALSKKTGASTAWYVREGIEHVLAKYKKT